MATHIDRGDAWQISAGLKVTRLPSSTRFQKLALQVTDALVNARDQAGERISQIGNWLADPAFQQRPRNREGISRRGLLSIPVLLVAGAAADRMATILGDRQRASQDARNSHNNKLGPEGGSTTDSRTVKFGAVVDMYHSVTNQGEVFTPDPQLESRLNAWADAVANEPIYRQMPDLVGNALKIKDHLTREDLLLIFSYVPSPTFALAPQPDDKEFVDDQAGYQQALKQFNSLQTLNQFVSQASRALNGPSNVFPTAFRSALETMNVNTVGQPLSADQIAKPQPAATVLVDALLASAAGLN